MDQVSSSKIEKKAIAVDKVYSYYPQEWQKHKQNILKVAFRGTNYFTSYIQVAWKLSTQGFSLILFNDDNMDAKIGLANVSKGFPLIIDREPIIQYLYSVSQISKMTQIQQKQLKIKFQNKQTNNQLVLHFFKEETKQKWVSLLTVLKHFKRCKLSIEEILDEKESLACHQTHLNIKKTKQKVEQLELQCLLGKQIIKDLSNQLQHAQESNQNYANRLGQTPSAIQFNERQQRSQENYKKNLELQIDLLRQQKEILQNNLRAQDKKVEKLNAQNAKMIAKIKQYEPAFKGCSILK